jgi:hypothetical protein
MGNTKMAGARETRVKSVPAKLLRAKLFAANALAAYNGYASTKNVNIPLKTRTVLLTVSHVRIHVMGFLYEGVAIPEEQEALVFFSKAPGWQVDQG